MTSFRIIIASVYYELRNYRIISYVLSNYDFTIVELHAYLEIMYLKFSLCFQQEFFCILVTPDRIVSPVTLSQSLGWTKCFVIYSFADSGQDFYSHPQAVFIFYNIPYYGSPVILTLLITVTRVWGWIPIPFVTQKCIIACLLQDSNTICNTEMHYCLFTTGFQYHL